MRSYTRARARNRTAGNLSYYKSDVGYAVKKARAPAVESARLVELCVKARRGVFRH